MPGRKPWEQQDGETDKAYQAFLVYRDLGPERSFLKAYARTRLQNRPRTGPGQAPAEAPKTVPGLWKNWARRWRWKERADAYDGRVAQAQARAGEKAAVAVAETEGRTLARERAKSQARQAQILERLELDALQALQGGRLQRQVLVQKEGATVKMAVQDAHKDLQMALKLSEQLFGQPEAQEPETSRDDPTRDLLAFNDPRVVAAAQDFVLALENQPGNAGPPPDARPLAAGPASPGPGGGPDAPGGRVDKAPARDDAAAARQKRVDLTLVAGLVPGQVA